MTSLTSLTALCLPPLLYHVVLGVGHVTDYRVTPTPFQDVAFTSHVLSPFSQVRSLLDCVRQCARRADCRALTYVHRSRSCQSHSVVLVSGDPRMDLPHARTFVLNRPPIPDWVGTRCVTDEDCVGVIPERALYQSSQLPVCFKQRCLCPVGGFLSVRNKLCLQACPNNQLQSSYSLMYPGSGMNSLNHYTFSGTVEQCKNGCNAYSDCQNFEISGSTCFGARVTSVPAFVTNTASWNHYQRDCA